MKGKLIYILGIDGSGKTTLARNLYQYYNEKKPDSCVLALNYSKYTDELESAAKKAHTTRRGCFSAQFRGAVWGLDLLKKSVDVLLPTINMGKNVIVDRYDICNKVYTYMNCGNIEVVKLIHQALPKPDVYIYLDTDCRLAHNRILSRGDIMTPSESLDKLYEAVELYEFFIRENNLPIHRVSGNSTQDAVLKECVFKMENAYSE